MKEKVKKALSEIVKLAGWQLEDFQVDFPPKEIKSDIATNIPILVAKKYKDVTPESVAEKIKSLCKEQFSDYLFSDIQFSPPGFLNFSLSKDVLFEEIKQIIIQQNEYPKTPAKEDKLLIEFVSANPTGPLHIGHGRSAVLGDVLANIYKKLGYQVTKEYYINDRGRQIDILTASVIISIQDETMVDDEIKLWAQNLTSQTRYKGSYIKDIAVEVSKSFNKIDKNNIKDVTKFIVDKIMQEIKSSLTNFNVKFDNFFSESSLYETGLTQKVLESLKSKGLLEYKDNALWFKSEKLGDDKDRVVIKSNGEPTYFFSDIVYHYDKILRGYTWLINIWGTDHHGYLNRLKIACETIFESENKNVKLDIILYQLVSIIKNGQRVSMSTREGEFITLDEVVKEVGCDVTRFFLLTKSPNAHLDFDLELAKEHSLKNPVYYIQYAHTRCCGILAEVAKIVNLDAVNKNVEDYFEFVYKQQYQDIELELVKKLCFYPDILYLCAESFSIHHLCGYLIDLARIFHKFYEQCRVIEMGSVINYPRLLFVIATKFILNNALSILGISAPEKM